MFKNWKRILPVALAVSVSSISIGYIYNYTKQSQKSVAYKRAKKIMDPDLYLVYRLSDRILSSNNIKRPIRVAVRKGSDCEGGLGVAINSAKCAAAQFLPDIDKSTNFDIWASQVLNTMIGSPNAQASSVSGTLVINIPMMKELMGKPTQLACVISHELAHITQNHSEQKMEERIKFDLMAANRISERVESIHKNQKGAYTMAAIFGGLSAGISGDNSSLNNLSNQIAINNLASQIAEPQITAKAMEFSPVIGDSINKMKGLSPSYLKRASKYVDSYLRDASLALTAFGRGLEYEADLLGLEYVAASGFNPSSCVKLWTETMPHGTDKIIARLLPDGVKDPGQEEVSIFMNKEKEDVCGKKIMDPKNKIDCRKKIEPKTFCDPNFDDCGTPEYKKQKVEDVPEDVMALLSTHPSDERRAKALKAHLQNTNLINKLKNRGKEWRKEKNMRDWTYDKESNSVVISNIFKSPKNIGINDRGTTGIDVDKFLDN